MRTLIEQPEWDASYAEQSFSYDKNHLAFRDLLQEHVPAGGHCLEVGCFPGNFLLFMALEKGCRVSGIDATCHLPDMVSRFLKYPIQTGVFINERFEHVVADPAFDCVASFGFIEHFPDFPDVIRHHIDFLKPGGTLIIALPHFRRLQYVARSLLDPKTLAGHHLPSMDFHVLRASMLRQGLEIVTQSYWGTCAYWFDGRPYGPLRRLANRAAAAVLNFIDRHIDLPNRWTSPFMMVVARKPAP